MPRAGGTQSRATTIVVSKKKVVSTLLVETNSVEVEIVKLLEELGEDDVIVTVELEDCDGELELEGCDGLGLEGLAVMVDAAQTNQIA